MISREIVEKNVVGHQSFHRLNMDGWQKGSFFDVGVWHSSPSPQELTQRLTEEISCKHSLLSEESATALQGKDLYELEVLTL